MTIAAARFPGIGVTDDEDKRNPPLFKDVSHPAYICCREATAYSTPCDALCAKRTLMRGAVNSNTAAHQHPWYERVVEVRVAMPPTSRHTLGACTRPPLPPCRSCSGTIAQGGPCTLHSEMPALTG